MTDAITTTESKPQWVSLHNHSYYSLLDGLSSPKALATQAKKFGCPAVALTDHGTCAGLYQFQKACKEVDIKPILGIETYFTDNIEIRDKSDKRWHLTLFAKNKKGYENLIALSSTAYIDGFYNKPRIDMNLLKKHREGLIAGSACASGILCGPLLEDEFTKDFANSLTNRYCSEFQELFGDDFYIEIMSNQFDESKKEFSSKLRLAMKRLYEISQEKSIKAIFTCDSHYCLPEDSEVHDTLLSIQTKDTVKNPGRFTYGSKDFYLKSPEQIEALCGKEFKHLMDNTLDLANKVESDIIQPSKDLLPNFPLPKGFATEEDYLKSLLTTGMQVKGLINLPEYRDRILMEFKVIMATGYQRYFLILWDLIKFARDQKIYVGPGRGCFTPENEVICLKNRESTKKTINNIMVGDFVKSHDGKFHEVTKTHAYSVEEEMIKLEMEDGRVIRCTKDHEIYVLRDSAHQWVKASELVEDDLIIEYKNGKISVASVISTNIFSYKGIVHDLTVKDTSSYNINGLIVHNSGVASLCLYCLGVTALDPIKNKLMFSRFLSPDRVSPPDVDLDFDQTRQHEIFDYIVHKYGSDCIARIGTYTSLKAKDAIKRTGKALDIGGDWEKSNHSGGKWDSGKATLSLVDAISKTVPEGPDMNIKNALKESMELRQYESMYPKVFNLADRLQGTLSAAGVHPAGIVICREPVVLHSPLRVNKDVICTQYEMSEVEELGMLKIDVLALSTLTVVDKCLKLIQQRTGVLHDLNSLEPTDANIFNVLNAGQTDGVFQFEGWGITKLLKEIHVDSFDDMVAANAMFRPGTLRAGIHTMYCDYKHGRKEVSYIHPIMKEALGDTYGLMIYQENLTKVAVAMAGLSDSDADKLRKACGKKIPELMEKSKVKFIEGCIKNNIDKPIAEKVFSLIDFFSGYGFNRSHSAAYSFLSYQTAWLKYYFPLEFYCALLSVESDDEKRSNYERCASRFRGHNVQKMISILPVDINSSKLDYSIEGDSLRRPLGSLHGVGEKVSDVVVKNQPYRDFADFVKKTHSQSMNTTVLVALGKAGCFKQWETDAKVLLEQFEKHRDSIRKQKKRDKKYGDFEGSLIDF